MMPQDPFAAIAQPAKTGTSDPFAAIAEPAAPSVQKPSLTMSTGEGPIARNMTSFEAQLSQLPKNTVRLLLAKHWPILDSKNTTELWEDIKSLNPVMHEYEGGPIDYGATAANLLPFLVDMEGGGITTSPAVESVRSGLSKVGELRTAAADTAQSLARRATESTHGVKDAVVKTGNAHGEALEKNAAARTAQVKSNLAAQRSALTDIDREKITVAEKNRVIEEENKAQADQVAKREDTARTVDERSLELRESLGKVEEAVGKEANAKFQAVREKIGNPEAPSEPLIGIVRGVERDILQDIPENIKEFRAILKLEPELGLEQIMEDEMTPEPVTWDKLQSLKSRLDARLRAARGGKMNGDLKRGLFVVRDGVVDQMGEMAEANDAEEEWGDAKNFWRNYKQDFHEPRGPSGSGSPIAQALDAVDPKNVRQPFIQKQAATGNRALNILRQYPQFGGTEAAALAEDLLKTRESMRGLPEQVKPKATVKAKEAHQLPTSKPAPKIPETPTVDLEAEARKHVESTATRIGRLNAWDYRILGSSLIAGFLSPFLGLKGGVGLGATYVGTKFLMSSLLEKPGVIEWIARTPPAELAAIQKLPQAQLVNIKTALTDAAVKLKAPPSPELRAFLGPVNTAKILAVTGASQVRNRKDAINVLNRPASQ